MAISIGGACPRSATRLRASLLVLATASLMSLAPGGSARADDRCGRELQTNVCLDALASRNGGTTNALVIGSPTQAQNVASRWAGRPMMVS